MKLYWTLLGSCLLGAAVLWNRRKYPEHSWGWLLAKASVDAALVALLAAFLPVMLVAYSTLFTAEEISARFELAEVWRVTLLVLSGIFFSRLALLCSKAVWIVAAGAIDMVTGRFLQIWQKRWKEVFG